MPETTASLNEEQLLTVLSALKDGDFSVRLPSGAPGATGQIAETVNAFADQLGAFTAELSRISREIGTEGRFGGQAEVEGLSGSWKDLLDIFNDMAVQLTNQVRDFSQTAQAAASGNSARRVTVPANGETAELKDALNVLVDQRSRSN